MVLVSINVTFYYYFYAVIMVQPVSCDDIDDLCVHEVVVVGR